MRHDSWQNYASSRKLVTALFFSFAACLVSAGGWAATRASQSAGTDLDRLIPREQWAASGLDKLTPPEQQTLADEIAGLLGSARTRQSSAPTARDKSPWRKLHRRMSRDDVKKLLGEPDRISVSRFYESWEYLGGSVTFDAKGHVDFWSEP